MHPTKKLGQNFVVEPGTVRQIAALAAVRPGDVILEVGPGLGSLTLALIEAAAQASEIEVCRQIRRKTYRTRDLPVIMVTARTEDQDAVRGLNTGADDYITKPFNIEALLARMRALLRRSNAVPVKGQLAFHNIEMDLASHRVSRNNRRWHLGRPVPSAGIFHTASTAGVLKLLKRCGVRTFMSNPVPVDVHIRRLRKSINGPDELDVVRTVRHGYALDTEPL